MYRTDAVDNIAIIPASTATGTVGYYQDGGAGVGTVVDAEHLNMIQEELVAVLTLFGVVLNKAVLDQIALELEARIMSIVSNATDTGSITTDQTRAVIASSSGRASGAKTAVIASLVGHASGDESAVVASQDADATGRDCLAAASDGANVSGDRATVLATFAQAGGDVANAGDQCAIIASEGLTAAPTFIDVSSAESLIAASTDSSITGGNQSVVLASDGVDGLGTRVLVAACQDDASGDPDCAGSDAVVLASHGPVKGSGTRVAAIACEGNVIVSGDKSAALAAGILGVTNAVGVSGDQAAVIGTKGDITVSGSRSVVIASDFTTGAAVTQATNDTLSGGTNGSIKWAIDSATGKAALLKLRMDDEVAIDAAAALATIGKGPTGFTTAMAKWAVVDVGGTEYVIPLWIK